jgi:hypothetical protein
MKNEKNFNDLGPSLQNLKIKELTNRVSALEDCLIGLCDLNEKFASSVNLNADIINGRIEMLTDSLSMVVNLLVGYSNSDPDFDYQEEKHNAVWGESVLYSSGQAISDIKK